MNDLTTEELILLNSCVFSKYIDSLRDPTIEHLIDDLRKLGKKIQSIINNHSYCEHLIARGICIECGKNFTYEYSKTIKDKI